MLAVKQFLIAFLCLLYACRIVDAQDVPSDAKTKPDPQVQSLVERIKNENDRPSWPIDRLTRESDAILACEMISQVRVDYDASIAGDYAGPSIDCYVTKLAVLAALKGNVPPEIEVVTIKYSTNVGFVGRKHDFARFYTKLKLPVLVEFVVDDKIDGYGANDPVETTTIEPEYLVFLRQRDDRRYEPITGQRYSALSIRVLNK